MFNIYADSFMTATRTDARRQSRRKAQPEREAEHFNPGPMRALPGVKTRR
ncbi:hypothetical protein [Tranquillimonas alkanivorans]|uniref:Uncharacterized protein n=1 Tax=Tranquillimonas alkanivorans TaxID=441119 RepID=A0A1I5UGH9_9RHOB|nr:hypothetical protein [Tranquillimonas alkanivorans]SFP94391.1 hypothetical protein SAMN04488047_12030 [Tranquillimonas alkanivorans]